MPDVLAEYTLRAQRAYRLHAAAPVLAVLAAGAAGALAAAGVPLPALCVADAALLLGSALGVVLWPARRAWTPPAARTEHPV